LFTWDRLCPLLQRYSEVKEQFYGEISPGATERIEERLIAIQGGMASLTLSVQGDDIDDEINEARDYIPKREFEIATLLLNRVLNNKSERLSARQRFRVLSNQGAAALGLGRAKDAAKLFLEALRLQPNDEKARVNEVLAYFLVGDFSASHSKAEVLRGEFPGSSRLNALWIMTAPKHFSARTLQSAIDAPLLQDAEVCVAIVRRSLMDLDLENALTFALAASTAAPAWSQPQLLLALVSLGRAQCVQPGSRIDREMSKRVLAEAEDGCTKAIDLARLERDQVTELEAYVNRVDVRLLQGKEALATEDAECAYRLDQNDNRALLAMAHTRAASGRTGEGIATLAELYRRETQPEVAFLYARLLSGRGHPDDLQEAVRILLQIPVKELPAKLRPAVVVLCVQCLSRIKSWDAAEEYITGVSDCIEAVVPKALRGFVAYHQGKTNEAGQLAIEAKSLLTSSVEIDAKEFCGRLLMLVGRPADALPVWQELFDLDVPGFDPASLLDCAARLRRDDIVIETCARLHERGVHTWELVVFEVPYLEKYRINAAINRLENFISLNPSHKLSKLQLSAIGLRLGRNELVHARVQDLPDVSELPLEYVLMAVQVMKCCSDPMAAVDYAYRFLRLHFNEVEAHQAFQLSMLPGQFSPDIPPALETVENGSAVCYQELVDANLTWAVIEDTAHPSADFEEVSLASPLAKEMIGRRVGDEVLIARGSFQNRAARIVQILPKYVRRYQDSLGEMQVRFGAASSVESVRIEQTADGGPPKGLDVILTSVERRAAAVSEARKLYSNTAIPIHVFGSFFGEGAYDGVFALAAEDEQFVKCCTGSLDERKELIGTLKTANILVVDVSALATLRLLGLEKVLETTRFRFVVSERAWLSFKEGVLKESILSAPGGFLSYKDGRPVMYERSAEDRQRQREADEEFVQLIQKHAEIRSDIRVAALSPEKRDVLEKAFGTYGTEAMIIASDPETVLWTDDLIQAQFAAQEFGARRVWTQGVLGSLAETGLLSLEEYSDATARLLGFEYMSTSFDGSSMLAAFRLAEWSPERKPAAQVLRVFSNPGADLQGLFSVLVEFVRVVYRESATPEVRDSVTCAVLDHFARLPMALDLLVALRKRTSRLFGINVVGRTQFEKCFDRWKTDGSSGIIHLA